MARALLIVVLAALAGGTSACRQKAAEFTPGPASTNRQVYTVKGVVQSVQPGRRQVEIRHEEVPGFMPAMTMPFDVKDTNELAGLEPGQAVTFRLTVGDTEAWIDQIRKLGVSSTGSPPAARPATRIAREVEPLAPGDPLPAYQLTNQLGKAFSTADFKGQAVALTFLFTRCPYPTFCPKMTAGFQAAQQTLLTSRPALTNWHLLAISFDPEYDTPAVLQAYTRGMGTTRAIGPSRRGL